MSELRLGLGLRAEFVEKSQGGNTRPIFLVGSATLVVDQEEFLMLIFARE